MSGDICGSAGHEAACAALFRSGGILRFGAADIFFRIKKAGPDMFCGTG